MNDAPLQSSPAPLPLPEHLILGIVAAYAAAFVAFGLLVDGPVTVMRGLIEIVTTRDALLTDYFGLGGKGAACVTRVALIRCLVAARWLPSRILIV